MANTDKINKLKAALNSSATPESLKPRIQSQIEALEAADAKGKTEVKKPANQKKTVSTAKNKTVKKPTTARTVKTELKKYYTHRDIKTVTILEDGKKVIYAGKDVLNGANFLAKGGLVKNIATYVPIRNIVEVELEDGSIVKPANGYHIKDAAKPIKYSKGGTTLKTPTESELKLHLETLSNEKLANDYAYIFSSNLDRALWKVEEQIFREKMIDELASKILTSSNKEIYLKEVGYENEYAKGGVVWETNPQKKVKGIYHVKADGFNGFIEIVGFEKYNQTEYSIYQPSFTEFRKGPNNVISFKVNENLLNKIDKGETITVKDKLGNPAKIKRVADLGSKGFFEEGGQVDLFENQAILPIKVQEILDKYADVEEYSELQNMQRELEAHGYTFEFGLDAVPFNLHKIENKVQVTKNDDFDAQDFLDTLFPDVQKTFKQEGIEIDKHYCIIYKGKKLTPTYLFFAVDEKPNSLTIGYFEDNKTLYGELGSIVFELPERVFYLKFPKLGLNDVILYEGKGDVSKLEVDDMFDYEGDSWIIESINGDKLLAYSDKEEKEFKTEEIASLLYPKYAKGGWTTDHRYVNHSEDYEVRYAKGKNRKGYMEKGGQIINYYQNHYENDIWDKIWTDEQKRHFLRDHCNEIGFDEDFYNEYTNRVTEKATSSKGTNIGYKFKNIDKILSLKSSELPRYVNFHFKKHLRDGQYAKGGWTTDHRYLNKSEKYEVNYAKGKNRKSYMEKGGKTPNFDYKNKYVADKIKTEKDAKEFFRYLVFDENLGSSWQVDSDFEDYEKPTVKIQKVFTKKQIENLNQYNLDCWKAFGGPSNNEIYKAQTEINSEWWEFDKIQKNNNWPKIKNQKDVFEFFTGLKRYVDIDVKNYSSLEQLKSELVQKKYFSEITTLVEVYFYTKKEKISFDKLKENYFNQKPVSFENLSVTLAAEPNPDYDRNSHNGSIKIKERRVQVKSIQEAKDKVKEYIKIHDLGGGNFTGGKLYSNDKKVGYISYNGRVWDNDDYEIVYEAGGKLNENTDVYGSEYNQWHDSSFEPGDEELFAYSTKKWAVLYGKDLENGGYFASTSLDPFYMESEPYKVYVFTTMEAAKQKAEKLVENLNEVYEAGGNLQTWFEKTANDIVKYYLNNNVKPNEVNQPSELKHKGDYLIEKEGENYMLDICFGDEFEKNKTELENNYSSFVSYAENKTDGEYFYELQVLSEPNSKTIQFLFESPKDEYAKGGKTPSKIIVTPIHEIPNFESELENRKVTYRGLGMGKLSDDFFKVAGQSGVRLKVKGKEYFVTDSDFRKVNWDDKEKKWLNKIRFDAPFRKYKQGGSIVMENTLLQYSYPGYFENGGLTENLRVGTVFIGKPYGNYETINNLYRNDTSYVLDQIEKEKYKVIAVFHRPIDAVNYQNENLDKNYKVHFSQDYLKFPVGRLAKGKTLEDIAKMHDVTLGYIEKQMARGKKVEMEHTTDDAVATAIAKDHLYENPDYYILLSKMEKKFEKGGLIKKLNYKVDKQGVYVSGTLENDIAKLDSIELSKSKQKQGLGTLEYEKFEQWAKENGAKEIQIDAYKKSIGFWEKMGFELEKDFPIINDTKQDYKFGVKKIKNVLKPNKATDQRGKTSVFTHAKKIRLPNEPWKQCVQRAKKELDNKKK